MATVDDVSVLIGRCAATTEGVRVCMNANTIYNTNVENVSTRSCCLLSVRNNNKLSCSYDVRLNKKMGAET